MSDVCGNRHAENYERVCGLGEKPDDFPARNWTQKYRGERAVWAGWPPKQLRSNGRRSRASQRQNELQVNDLYAACEWVVGGCKRNESKTTIIDRERLAGVDITKRF